MKHILLNNLKEEQDKHGFLSEYILKQISIEKDIPIAKLYGVVNFYTMLKTQAQGKYVIEICGSTSCMLNNSVSLEKFLEKKLKINIGETTKDKLFTLFKTSCIGCCDVSPAMLVNGKPHTNLTKDKIDKFINTARKENANS